MRVGFAFAFVLLLGMAAAAAPSPVNPDPGAPAPADVIFSDAFEGGTLAAWSSSAADGGDLGASSDNPLGGAFDLRGVVNDTAPLFVEDSSPVDEEHYRARFRFDPRNFDPGMAQGHLRIRIFVVFEEGPVRRLSAIVLRRQGAQYSLLGRVRRDDNSQADTGFFDVTDAPHLVELEWKRATVAGSDGEFRLWIDDQLRSTLTGLANRRSSVDFVRLGALSVKGGASGELRWDDFESRRNTYIGFTSCAGQRDGTLCTDDDFCTATSACQAGACVMDEPECPPMPSCWLTTCDSAARTCVNTAMDSACDDGNPCTTDTCEIGGCSSAPVQCTPLDPCHLAGTCDPGSGACSDPAAPDGKPCDDGDSCTSGDVCVAGSCVGGSPTCGPI